MSISSETGTTTPKIIDLADRLLADIESRKLKPGDRYMTTAAASKMLGVGNGVANRALQLLERRQVIVRQQRRGAFIAGTPESGSPPPLRRVHFLVHRNYLTTEGVGNDLVLLGMQEALPGVHVQISFLPTSNATDFVADLVDQSLTAKAKDGFILVRVPYEVQQLISDRGVPGVVYGALYANIERLTRFDRDMSAVGRLAIEYLLAKGHRRIAQLSRQQALPGDHDTMDAIRRLMGENGLLASAITERFLPTSPEIYTAEVRRLLEAAEPPTGFICRSRQMADAAVQVFNEMGLQVNRDVDVVVCDYYLLPNQKPQYVFPRPIYSSEEQGRRMAQLLLAQSKNQPVDNEIIPVELDTSALEEPDSN
jgi:DNA-binding LacI/PurR family transcriptional regulator/DNA-binding transcriptional regulator YhcF (GntR family)